MSDGTNKIKYLVADTTAFINAVPLNDYADNILTVPDVVAEVRNKRQLRRLCVLPFDLQVREPSSASIKHCIEFAKKTGDYASLSGIDLKVISLTYELEVENVGTKNLRNEPVVAQIVASRDKPTELQDNTKLAGWYTPNDNEDSSDEYENEIANEHELKSDINKQSENSNGDVSQDYYVDELKLNMEKALEEHTEDIEHDNRPLAEDDVTQEELEKLFEKLKCEPTAEEELETCKILVPDEGNNETAESESDSENEANNVINNEEGGWITPQNIKKVKKRQDASQVTDVVPIVACMTTDYALQNVLKQINLNITALNGHVIKHLRTYILRCYSCFNTTSIMTKVFCPKCGNKTLKRVAVSLDENGKQIIHINTRRPLTAKYKNQSLPRFKGGKHSRNPILFEDQPIPRQMPSRVAKTKTNALSEDYISGYSPFVMRDVDSKSAMLRAKGNLKEWARNNNFEEDRRRKNYNRLYK